MKKPVNNDNIYKAGTTIFARTNPTEKLLIVDYKDRIYYCDTVGLAGVPVRAFFERELIQNEQPINNLWNV